MRQSALRSELEIGPLLQIFACLFVLIISICVLLLPRVLAVLFRAADGCVRDSSRRGATRRESAHRVCHVMHLMCVSRGLTSLG